MNADREALLLRSLCFMAMTGGPSRVLRTPALDPATLHAPVPTVQFAPNGSVKQLFSVRNSESTYQVWTLTFSGAGKLLAANSEEYGIRAKSRTRMAMAAGSTSSGPSLPSTPLQPQLAVVASPAAAPADLEPQFGYSGNTTPSLHSVARLAGALSLPLPQSRFIPDPLSPPHRIIPDAALEAPPHMP